jgi:hypothetical protein
MMKFRYPTFDEMRALEFAARRAREREIRRLIGAAAAALGAAIQAIFRAAGMLTQIKNLQHPGSSFPYGRGE